jgi:4-amino-4-deoxy-L-arabinose transferase-like glycosyltransferase
VGRRRSSWWPLAAFLAAVFVVKLVVMLQLRDHPLVQPEGGLDSLTYVHLAERVQSGDLALGPGLYFVSPLYIYFLALTLWIGGSFTFVRIVQISLGTCADWMVFLSARDWFGSRAAWFAAGFAALTGVFTFYEILILQSALDTFLTSAALYALTRAFGPTKRPELSRSVSVAVAGVMFGLQILNRPNVGIAVAGAALGLLAIRRWRLALWLTAGVAIALIPVTVRNAVVTHQFAVVSSQGGLNFYIGNHAAATGQYNAIPGVRANIEGQSADTRRVAEQATGRPLTDIEVSSYFTALALSWIRNQPTAAARLFIRKLALVFNHRHQWLDFSYPYYAHDTGSILGLLFVGPWLLVPLGFAGFACAHRESTRGSFLVWAAFMPLYALSVTLFFVAERYRLPLFVPLCVTSGAAADALVGGLGQLRVSGLQLSTFSARPLLASAALFIFGGIVTAWPFHLNDGRYDERLRLAKVLMEERDFGRAAAELEEAHRMDPSNSVAEFNLGLALMNDGRASDGSEHIRRAVDAGVPVEGARYALAAALLEVNRNEAVTLLRTFVPGPKDTAESCYQVALLALDAGVPDVAERYIRRALELHPGWPEAEQLLQRLRS